MKNESYCFSTGDFPRHFNTVYVFVDSYFVVIRGTATQGTSTLAAT